MPARIATSAAVAEQELMAELRSAREAGRRRPDFFVVGHAKCGTTALYEMLRRHPQIYMPALKEPQYLSRALHYRQGSARLPAQRPHTLEAYLSLFADAPPDQRAGEASTDYLRSTATAARIRELQPDARIVAIFREPVEFLRSLHLQLLQVGAETEPDFGAALELESSRREDVLRGEGHKALLYSEHVRYAEQLRAYRACFPPEQLLTLIYDDFRSDNARALRQVLGFLGVDEAAQLEPVSANPTVRVRSRSGEQLLHGISVGRGPGSRALRRAIKMVTSERVRGGALHAARRAVVDREPPPPDERTVAELRRRFKGEVVAAGECLDRDLVSLWGYDELV